MSVKEPSRTSQFGHNSKTSQIYQKHISNSVSVWVWTSGLDLMPRSDKTRRNCDVSRLLGKPLRYEAKTKRFLCDLNAINGSEGSRNNNIIMPPGKKPGFMLHQVRRPADRQTTLKMPVSWMEFGLIRAMLCWDAFPKHTRFSDFLANFPPQQPLYLSRLSTSRCVIVQICVSTNVQDKWLSSFLPLLLKNVRTLATWTSTPIFLTMLAWQEFLPLFRHLFLKIVDLNDSKPRQKTELRTCMPRHQ